MSKFVIQEWEHFGASNADFPKNPKVLNSSIGQFPVSYKTRPDLEEIDNWKFDTIEEAEKRLQELNEIQEKYHNYICKDMYENGRIIKAFFFTYTYPNGYHTWYQVKRIEG